MDECFYRVSVCAVVLDESHTRFLLTKERNDQWAIPGGGMERGESPHEALKREVLEEMGLTLTHISETPAYIASGQRDDGVWSLNIIYEAKLEHLNFTESDECTEIRFVSPEESLTMNIYSGVKRLAEAFDPKKHVT